MGLLTSFILKKVQVKKDKKSMRICLTDGLVDLSMLVVGNGAVWPQAFGLPALASLVAKLDEESA